jgi:hypothetical protein
LFANQSLWGDRVIQAKYWTDFKVGYVYSYLLLDFGAIKEGVYPTLEEFQYQIKDILSGTLYEIIDEKLLTLL